MRRTSSILATLLAAIAVATGAAGLRALHVATAPEHAGHRAAQVRDVRAASACGHVHGHSCGSQGAAPGAADASAKGVASRADGGADRGHTGHSHDAHETDCATCDLLTTLSADFALPVPVLASAEAAGDSTLFTDSPRAVRTLASVRARPPPSA